MRLEQLVLFGPSDHFSISFGPRVTVMSGLDDAERHGLLRTMVDAMAGVVPNASVIFVDHAGRRVYADRTGATYAESGVAAPSLAELLGTDPTVVEGLVTLRPGDLGLGTDRDQAAIEAELAAARDALADVRSEEAAARTIVVQITSWEEELAALDERIAALPEQQARWDWMALRDQLDARRADLAALDGADHEDRAATDERLLAAVEELRAAGETWIEASAAAEQLSRQLGPLPPVHPDDLARVAATPEELPADLDDRLEALAAACEATAAAEAAVDAARKPAEDPGDGVVYQLAQIDQEQLWAAYVAARKAEAIYEAARAEHQDDVDPATESEIDLAHQEVVRAQREQDRFTRPGAIGSAALAAASVLAAMELPLPVAVLAFAGAVALAIWLLVVPRRRVAAALAAEAEALAAGEATSWLGVHLRRLDEVLAKDHSGLRAALDLRTRTKLDWEELTGGVSLDAAGSRQEAIEAYAVASDPTARAAHEARMRDELARARRAEDATRRALAIELVGFGLPEDGGIDLEPGQLRTVLEQRAAAGRFARGAVELQHQLATATSASGNVDRLLRQLGFDDGDLAGRLERAILAIEQARARQEDGDPERDRAALEAEIAELAERVEAGRRPSWDHEPDPAEPPADQATLMDARRALAEEVAGTRRPDLTALGRRIAVAEDRVRTLEAERSTFADGAGAVRRRLVDRVGRTTWIGPNEESLPIILDDALLGAEPGELFELLDLVVRLSTKTQVILLTSDPTVSRWARREVASGAITLLESAGALAR